MNHAIVLLIIGILFFSCSSSLKTTPINYSQSVNTIGICFQSKQNEDLLEVKTKLMEDVIDICKQKPSFPESRIFSIESDSLTKIESCGKGKKNIRTYIPSHPGIEVEGFKPDIILFIKNVSAEDNEKENLETKGYGVNKYTTVVSSISTKYSVTFLFWDNRNGSVINYGKLEKKLNGGSNGPSVSKQLDLAHKFAYAIVSSTTFVSNK